MSTNQPDFRQKPILDNELLCLQPFNETDIPELLAIISDPTVKRLTGSSPTSLAAQTPMSQIEITQTTEWYASRNQQTDRLDLAIYSKSLGKTVGEVVINDWDADNNSANFRILIGQDGRNQGFGSIATKLIVAYAFEYLKLHRLELEVFAFNPRARHVYEKNGFIYEGTRRDAFNFDGQWVNSDLYAILASDYLRIKNKP